ncbi:MAG: hypothetical protein GY937_10210 [bacterium]|nr:hypothetical protein [bacterium]
MPTKTTSRKTTQVRPSPNGPNFIVYQVIDRGDEQKAIWRAVGSGWMHNDGNGIQVRLDSFPVGGVVTLRTPLPPKSES